MKIKAVIKIMKTKKAAGEDKIPNQAWIYGEDKMLKDLHKVINGIWKRRQKLSKEWKADIATPIHKNDMKRAFNRIESRKICKIMEEKSINARLRKRIKEIYEGTKCKVRVRDEISEKIKTINEV